MDTDFAKIIAVALEAASAWLRNAAGDQSFDEMIRDTMESRSVDPDRFEEVFLLVEMLLGFSDAVRVAERNGAEIIPLVGEKPKRGA